MNRPRNWTAITVAAIGLAVFAVGFAGVAYGLATVIGWFAP